VSPTKGLEEYFRRLPVKYDLAVCSYIDPSVRLSFDEGISANISVLISDAEQGAQSASNITFDSTRCESACVLGKLGNVLFQSDCFQHLLVVHHRNYN